MNLSNAVKKQLKQKALQKFDRTSLVKKAELIKRQLLTEFENHKVTKEIRSGPTGKNITKTLSGSENGNLYSFIGFDQNAEDPTKSIYDLLSSITIQVTNSSEGFFIKIKIPSLIDIWEATPMPWQEGRSWAKGIESGISGLNFYLFSKNGFENSRSGTAVQSGKLRSFARYIPTQYISNLMKKYRKKFSSLSKDVDEITFIE
jgi:hypothetical protein